MDTSSEYALGRRIGYEIDPEATTHNLLNDATEWLQFARGLAELLAELVHESETVTCQRMALGLEAIGALTRMGLQCTSHAHARMCWEKTRNVSVAAVDEESSDPQA